MDNKKRFYIVGAGIVARETLFAFYNSNLDSEFVFSGFLVDGFNEDHENLTPEGLGIVGTPEKVLHEDCAYTVGIAAGKIRENVIDKLGFKKLAPPIVHPTAYVADAHINAGCVIFPNSSLSVGVSLGLSVIVGFNVSVGCDCKLLNYSYIGSGSHLSDSVFVGERSLIKTGVTVREGVTLHNDTCVDAGSFVTENTLGKNTFISGNPAATLAAPGEFTY